MIFLKDNSNISKKSITTSNSTQQGSKSSASLTQTPDAILEEKLVPAKDSVFKEIMQNYTKIGSGKYKYLLCEKDHKKIKVLHK